MLSFASPPRTGKSGFVAIRPIAEGQEDQLGALGLILNVIVLWNTIYLDVWNTIYLDAVLTQLRAEGFPVHDEDVARLDPLGFDHINMLGRYSFAIHEAVARGELRPLRDPREAAAEAA
jgi:hypothetical protein